jgi:predicted nucleotidyltransferase
MISDKDKKAIIAIAKKYKIRRLLLFGSSVDLNREANDIDLAVEGLSEDQFFKFYSELIFNLSKPVDLVDIGKKSRFKDLIVEESVPLYG